MGRIEVKKCPDCKEIKDVSLFYNNKANKDRLFFWCKACDTKHRTRRRANNLAHEQLQQRKNNLKVKYKLTLEQYNDILTEQDNKCAICKTTNPTGEGNTTTHLTNFAVDHCHKTNKIRGLLCNRCNRGLGFFRDSEDLLTKAYNYIVLRK